MSFFYYCDFICSLQPDEVVEHVRISDARSLMSSLRELCETVTVNDEVILINRITGN